MAKYDLEKLVADIKSIMVNNLNTKIAAIEAEKVADGQPATGLEAIDSASYFEQTFSDAVMAVSPALFYGVESVKSKGIGPTTEQVITIFAEVILVEKQDGLTVARIHRYSRALKEIFEENFSAVPASNIKVETVRPVSFKLDENTSEWSKVGGVSLTIALA